MRLFRGCRTRAEAEARMRAFLEQRHVDSIRKMKTDLLTSGDVALLDDPDETFECLDSLAHQAPPDVDRVMREFAALLDEHHIGPER
jgi:hypothetical protein